MSQAGMLAYNIINNHPFVDGNKRTAVAIMGIHLRLNGLELTASNGELFDFALDIANGANMEYVTEWLKFHTKNS